MDIQEKEIHLYMDATRLRMEDLIHGLKQGFFQEYLQRQIRYLTLIPVNLKLKNKKWEQAG